MSKHFESEWDGTEKRCSTCNEVKALELFSRDRSRPDGRKYDCKTCSTVAGRKWASENRAYLAEQKRQFRIEHPRMAKSYFLKMTYGINIYEYDAMMEKQNSVCAICKQPETAKYKSGETFALSVDHCHHSSQVRGLLCAACNHGIGRFKDDPALLLKAVEYLETHNSH